MPLTITDYLRPGDRDSIFSYPFGARFGIGRTAPNGEQSSRDKPRSKAAFFALVGALCAYGYIRVILGLKAVRES